MKIECTVEELKELLKKEQTECKSECSVEEIKTKIETILSDELQNLTQSDCKNECRRFLIKDPETKKKFESLFEQDYISHEELVFIIATIKSCWNNN